MLFRSEDAPADAPEDAPADAPEDAPADAPVDAPEDAPVDAPTAPTPGAPTTPTPTPNAAASSAPTPSPGAPAPSTPPPADAGAPATPDAAADTSNAEKQISPETKEALDIDRFVKHLNKQEGNISKVKTLLKVINLATKELDPADVANTFKMLKIATTKKLAKLNQENTPKK